MESDRILNTDHVPPPEGLHPETLEQKNPWIVMQIFYLITEILSNYGWFLLIGGAVAIYIRKKFRPKYETWQVKREEAKDAAEYHKNPDRFIAREQAIQEARLRMQIKYDETAKERAEIVKQREEEKRQAVIENWEKQQRGENPSRKILVSSSSASSSSSVARENKKSTKPRLRPDYNPLLGGDAGCGYRPARRGGAQGG